MKNTEKEFNAEQKAANIHRKKTSAGDATKPAPPAPGEVDGKPTVILPIIDAGKGDTANKEEFNAADVQAEADEIDSGNNYTAAENDHNTNSTL